MIVICFSHFGNSYAQSSEDNTTNNMILFVPQKMIVGEEYQGMVTLLYPTSSSSLILLSVDDDFILEVDSSVYISTNKNHGTFKLTPLNEGKATVSMLYDGEILSVQTKVFSKKSDAQKLKVILPTNSTIATDLKGFVFLLDGNDSPILSEFDRVISLISSEKIYAPTNIVIQNGSNYAIFNVQVMATGEITAIAPQLEPHTASIEKSQQTIDVKIGIAPNIILEESYTNYFIWLEKDGKPYTTKGVQKVQLQSSNTDVIRLGINPATYKNEDTIIISMYDGMAKGRLYTGTSGIVEISASIDNFGHSSTTVYVGTTLIGTDNDNLSLDEYTTDLYDHSDINYIQFSIYPDITNDVAYGVVSLYYAVQTEEIDIIIDDEDGTQISNVIEQTVLVPIKTEDILVSISSQSGLKHDSSYVLYDVAFPTHSKIFEITAKSVGDYTVTVTGGSSYATSNLVATTDNISSYSIHTTELPILSHTTQPLLMVSIVDENGYLLDTSELFGTLISMDVYSTNGKISSSSVTFDDNVGVVSGLFTTTGTVNISSANIGTASQNITPSGVAVSLEFFTPSIVHSGEPFPITIHEVDSMGIPLTKIDPHTVSSSGFDVINGDIISVTGDGEKDLAILSSIGGGFQKQITVFVNKIDFLLDITNNTPRLGESVIINIDSPIKNIIYDIDSPFSYKKIDETTFEIIPDKEIEDAEITIFGTLEGFVISNKQVYLSPVNLVEISVSANTIHGDIITPKYTIKQTDSESTNTTPHIETLKPQSVILEFPEDWKTVTSGYKIIDLTINGKRIDGSIVEFYADNVSPHNPGI